MTLIEAGVDYCRSHHGIRNEDENRCDFVTRDPWDSEWTCLHGDDPEGSVDDLKRDDCDLCDEEGVTLCDLTPLLYENGVES